jgi:CBS domain-containing protein
MEPVDTTRPPAEEPGLASYLADLRPFDALDQETLRTAAEAATVADYAPGQLIVDAFTEHPREIFVVLRGEVDLWHDPDRINQTAEDRFTAGSVLGFSAMLTERRVGPRVVASTPARVARIPATLVEPAFYTRSGARFLAEHISHTRGLVARTPSYSTVEDLVVREQIRRAQSVDELVERARAVPEMLRDSLSRGLSSDRVITVYSATVDALVRQSIHLVFESYPDLSVDAFTWLSLGSNGRREAVLSSDVDAAVAFDDSVSEQEMARYRVAFEDVNAVLARAGITVDTHGACASKPAFSRTNKQWRAAAKRWLSAPEENKGAIMASLLVDARPIHGDPGLPEVAKIFGSFREHPATMSLLLAESLSHRAKTRSMRDILTGKGDTFNAKTYGLLPVVNIARWAALGVGSTELQTTGRLRAAAGSQILPTQHAERLIEVFEVLQRLRLHHQLDQAATGKPPTDVIDRDELSPIERSMIARAVREITANQRRMDRVAQYVPTESWATRRSHPQKER